MAGTVDGVVAGGIDAAGARIAEVYARVAPLYAVYRTEARVTVQFADEPATAEAQRRVLMPLAARRARIDAAIDEWRRGVAPRMRARRFARGLAEALQLALLDDAAGAAALLDGVADAVTAERASIARAGYLAAAALATIVLMAIGMGAAAGLDGIGRQYSAGAAAGALGAFFSIALAIRGRRIAAEPCRRDTFADAALRVLIGAISAAAACCLLGGGLIDLGLGGIELGAALAGGQITAAALATGFVAGFSERLAGDMLDRVTPGERGAAAAAPANDADGCAGGTCVGTADHALPMATGGIAPAVGRAA